MIADLDRRVVELRFLEGIEKVEHVPYISCDEFWVRFNKPLDFGKLQEVVRKHGYSLVRFAGLPSKLPSKLAEVLWDGVSFVIGRDISGFSRLKASLGLEPNSIAKIANDLHGPYQIFIATDEAGIQLLYDYLGVKYTAPTPPPPKPASTPPKPVAPTTTKPTPVPVAQQPVTQPAAAPVAKPAPPIQPLETKTLPSSQQTQVSQAQELTAQPAPSTAPKTASSQTVRPQQEVQEQQPALNPPLVKATPTDQQAQLKKEEKQPATTNQS